MNSRPKRVADADTKFDRRGTSRREMTVGDDSRPRKRRATRDGREPLVVYMLPETIKSLKIAALQLDTTASALVSDAVGAWLDASRKRHAK